jgi:hypothetical protein
MLLLFTSIPFYVLMNQSAANIHEQFKEFGSFGNTQKLTSVAMQEVLSMSLNHSSKQ